MESVRSFIAIELPDELKRELSQLRAQLKPAELPWVKWVDPYGIHLTLKFLGNVDKNRLDDITGAMEAAVRGIPPFHLKIRELGVFPNPRRVQVAWVGINGEVDKLGQIQQRLESDLASLGFAMESRPFMPHLTLARLRGQVSLPERQRFGQLIVGTRFESAQGIKVDAISLIRSQLTREGAIYSPISLVGLKKPLSAASD